jgi:hypothetical protein
MARRDNLKNKRTFTWNDHHEVRLVFTEVFKRTEEDEQEQEQGYGGKKRRGGNKSSLLIKAHRQLML